MIGDNVDLASGEGLIMLTTYQPPPRIESALVDEDGFHLILRGEADRTIWLQRSTDLKTWEDWVILTATREPQAVADPSVGSQPYRFYRALGQQGRACPIRSEAQTPARVRSDQAAVPHSLPGLPRCRGSAWKSFSAFCPQSQAVTIQVANRE